MGTGTIILIAVVVIVIFWFVSCQRSLVHYDELCGNSLSQIGVQQSSRWDALTALADLTKSYSTHEYKTLMDVVSQRQSITNKSSVEDVQNQENKITEALGKIMAIAEAYPDLKAQQVYIETMKNVNQFENNVRQSRMIFNDSVTKYNRFVRQFPNSIVASILKYDTRAYLAEDKTKMNMPSMKIE